MAASLYDFSVDPSSPNFRGTTVPPYNRIPGTDWAHTAPQDFGINTKEGADAFNAMIYQYSNGISGAPMPPPAPVDPRHVIAKAYGDAGIARANAQFANRTPLGFGNSPVRNALRSGGGVIYPNRAATPVTGGTPTISPGVTTTIRSPAQQARLNANITQFSTGPVGTTKANSLTKFTQDFVDQRKNQKANLDQETAHVGRTYDPNGLESDLRRIAREGALLRRSAAEQAIRRAGRDNSVSRMVGGGVNSSYLDRAYGDSLGRILMDAALKGSDVDRENAMYLQAQRNGALGARSRMSQDYVDAGLYPYRALTELQAADLANLGRMGNLEDNYSIYDYVPADQAARRNLNLLSDLEETRNRFG